MAKSKRDLVVQWRDEAAQYETLRLAYKEREKASDVLKITVSAHYDKMAEMAAAHAMQLDTSSN